MVYIRDIGGGCQKNSHPLLTVVLGTPGKKYAQHYYQPTDSEATSIYKIPAENVTDIKYIFVPIFAIFVPILLVTLQPDLGTAVLILFGGLAVIWLTGFRIKFFLYSFFVLICLIPIGI